MGGVEEVCTGKTGTLTAGDMKVEKFFICQTSYDNKNPNTFSDESRLPAEAVDLVTEAVLFNCDARIEMSDTAHYTPVGNSTECGLINFLMENNVEAQELIKKKVG